MPNLTDPEAKLWWQSQTPGRDMVATAKAIEEDTDHRVRRRMNLMHTKLYCNRDLSSIYESGLAKNTYDAGVWLTMNLAQSCVDTVASKLWKTPRVQALVQDGDWSLKQKAKNLTRFGDGLWYVNKWNAESRRVGVDSTLYGSGIVHTYANDVPGNDDEGEILMDRVLADELIFDETEAVHGLKSLRTLYRKRWVHKQVLLEQWLNAGDPRPNKETREARRSAIMNAPGADPKGFYAANAGEMVALYEAWHLPSSPDADDGMRIVAIDGTTEVGCTFIKVPWKRRRFPLSFLPWLPLPTGLIGRSLVEELVPIQIRLNETLETITAGQNLMCVPKVFVQSGTLNMQSWTNAFAEIIEVNGAPGSAVQITTPPGVSPEMYKERDHWWKHGFEVTGISMLSATAQKPEGVGSAVALRELLDREDMRLTPKGKQWEEFHVDVFECAVDELEELSERNRDVIVPVPDKKLFRRVAWRKDVGWQKGKMLLQAAAVSSLPTTPQGRKQFAVEMLQLGAINRERFFQILDMPDTGSPVNLLISSLENTERAIEIMLETQTYVPPEEYADVVLARTMGMQAYLRERNEGAPEEVLDLLRRYIDECSELIDLSERAQPADQQAAATQAQAAQAEQVNAATANLGAPTAGPVPLQPVPETLAGVPAGA